MEHDLMKIMAMIPALVDIDECKILAEQVVVLREKAYNDAARARADVMLFWLANKMGELANADTKS